MRSHVFKLAVSGMFLLAGALACSANPSDFDAANKEYSSGDFSHAEQLYQKVVESKNYSTSLFYNLGNADFQLKKYGAASLNFERALALDPQDADARANLALAQKNAGAILRESNWMDRLASPLTTNSATLLAAVAGWIFLFVLVGMILRWRGALPIFLLVVSVLALAYAGGALWFFKSSGESAVITATKAEARQSATEIAPLVASLPAGSEVRLIGRASGWAYCALPSHDRAWIPSDSVQTIRL